MVTRRAPRRAARKCIRRHEERQDERAGGGDVDQRVRPVGLDEQAVPDRPGQHIRGDDDPDVSEGEEDGDAFAGPDIEEPPQPGNHEATRSLLQFLHRLG